MAGDREMTAREAAAALHCNVETIRRAIRKGELPARRHPLQSGHPFVVRADALDAWLKEREKV